MQVYTGGVAGTSMVVGRTGASPNTRQTGTVL